MKDAFGANQPSIGDQQPSAACSFPVTRCFFAVTPESEARLGWVHLFKAIVSFERFVHLGVGKERKLCAFAFKQNEWDNTGSELFEDIDVNEEGVSAL